MKRTSDAMKIVAVLALTMCLALLNCAPVENEDLRDLKIIGLNGEEISARAFLEGTEPKGFLQSAGAAYKPSFNEDPGIPAQCWIETGYGTQNACQYCHTDYLSTVKHGNAFPIGEDQEKYSFPKPALNRILWQNVIYPERITQRLTADGIAVPELEDVDYVRMDNWSPLYRAVRATGDTGWINKKTGYPEFLLFPALDPNHLFPFVAANPTFGGRHGYVDPQGFIRNEKNGYTGWRAVNFFPYALFTPLTGSVSGIYLRLPELFMKKNGVFSLETYLENLDILERNIKRQPCDATHYKGDASAEAVKKGFYPVGTEFAHPLHYVDLKADGEAGQKLDGVMTSPSLSYEFPGTRSKRVKEIRYMYKWKDVTLKDIALEDEPEGEESGSEEFETYIGREGQGWVDNGAGWILAAYIENRRGELRPQTTEELAQCIGCHAKTGNTIDSVWSLQRKLPGAEGWADMNYGRYNSKSPSRTRLSDYVNVRAEMGELGFFFHSVVGANLYGILPAEIRNELSRYAKTNRLKKSLGLQYEVDEILNDEVLKSLPANQRKPRLLERQKLMRHFSRSKAYLERGEAGQPLFIKGSVFYPSPETMKANIQGYRKVVLDQSFNLGKDIFGNLADHVPFTFRSDGTVRDEHGKTIPTGEVIYSRPYDKKGVGTTPTGISRGDAVDHEGNMVKTFTEDDVASGRFFFTGTLNLLYDPILSGKTVEP